MVVADSEVKNREDAGVAAARRYFMQVGAKILGPRFLVCFKKAYDARMSSSCRFKCLNGCKRGVEAVAVVSRASAVKTIVLDDRQPRAESFGPADGFGLLVEVAVKKDGTAGMPVGSRQVNEECRGNTGLREDFEGSCRKAFFAPLSGVLHSLQKKAMLFPFSIKGRTFGRDANESLHGIKGFACPGVVNVFLKRHHFFFAFSNSDREGRLGRDSGRHRSLHMDAILFLLSQDKVCAPGHRSMLKA